MFLAPHRQGTETRPKEKHVARDTQDDTSRESAEISERTNPASLARPSPNSRHPSGNRNPFALMSELSHEMDRVFGDFFLHSPDWSAHNHWKPALEVHDHDDHLIVRADLPGLKPEDVTVDVEDDTLFIRGERRQACEDNQDGHYRSECRYGTFFRSLPLPRSTTPENIRADFKDGVLSIRISTPKQMPKRNSIRVQSS